MMRTVILPLAALLTSLAACTVNSPREPAPEPHPPASPAVPSEPPTTQAPTAQGPTTQAPTTQAPTAQGPTTQAPTTTAPTAAPGPGGDDPLLGTWRSAVCGPRKYERVLAFAKGGSFTAEDRVSPCPPKVACVWSGIIQRKGAFKRAGDTLSLSVAEASRGPGAQELPTTLTVDAATGAPVEAGEGGKPCPYQR
ncbi:hypothetical protein WMF28_11730 [Sorangium sp. So ce590]|uniref:hypothetical protein n=1 Tax=Sorangium sp. So ce590 TaxID=3133317 RepID=UPI003F644E0F